MSMFKLCFETEDSVFADHEYTEIVRILREVADKIEQGNVTSNIIRDINGNKIGNFEFHD